VGRNTVRQHGEGSEWLGKAPHPGGWRPRRPALRRAWTTRAETTRNEVIGVHDSRAEAGRGTVCPVATRFRIQMTVANDDGPPRARSASFRPMRPRPFCFFQQKVVVF